MFGQVDGELTETHRLGWGIGGTVHLWKQHGPQLGQVSTDHHRSNVVQPSDDAFPNRHIGRHADDERNLTVNHRALPPPASPH
ncbi:hypothetical protein GCM10027290_23320 [Micromonospora sonneratiae]